MAAYKRKRSYLFRRPIKRRKVYKKNRRVFRRRVRRVGRRNYRVGTTVAQVFPNKRVVNHTYTCHGNINITDATTITFSTFYLKINSMYDPWYGVTGIWNVSPSLYTMMSSYYDHYAVIGTKVTATVTPISQFNLAAVNATYEGTGGGSTYSAVNIPPVRFGLFISDTNSPPSISTYTGMEMLRFHKYRNIQFTPFNAPVKKVSVGYSPKKFFNVKYDEDTVGANTGADPATIAWARCYAQPLDETTVPVCGQYHVAVRLKMKVMWSSPKDINVGQGS